MNALTVRGIIVGLRRRGVEAPAIADRLGVSESAVRRYLKQQATERTAADLRLSTPRRRPTDPLRRLPRSLSDLP